MCLLGDEASPAHCFMRATGDRGWVCREGKIYFAGRLDRQMKRSGHRISLDHIEQVKRIYAGKNILFLCVCLSLSHIHSV